MSKRHRINSTLQKIICLDNVHWYLDKKFGSIIGKHDSDSNIIYEFWIGNPPLPKDLNLFVEVCEIAMRQGLLRRMNVYAMV